LDNAWSSTN